MSRIRGKWTWQEKAIHNHLKGLKIKHKMHPKIIGNPDILLTNKKRVIFLDGCFWHGCPLCYQKPRRNKAYWKQKFSKNIKNDKKVGKLLSTEGYEIVRLWEHEIRNNDMKSIISRIIN